MDFELDQGVEAAVAEGTEFVAGALKPEEPKRGKDERQLHQESRRKDHRQVGRELAEGWNGVTDEENAGS